MEEFVCVCGLCAPSHNASMLVCCGMCVSVCVYASVSACVYVSLF